MAGSGKSGQNNVNVNIQGPVNMSVNNSNTKSSTNAATSQSTTTSSKKVQTSLTDSPTGSSTQTINAKVIDTGEVRDLTKALKELVATFKNKALENKKENKSKNDNDNDKKEEQNDNSLESGWTGDFCDRLGGFFNELNNESEDKKKVKSKRAKNEEGNEYSEGTSDFFDQLDGHINDLNDNPDNKRRVKARGFVDEENAEGLVTNVVDAKDKNKVDKALNVNVVSIAGIRLEENQVSDYLNKLFGVSNEKEKEEKEKDKNKKKETDSEKAANSNNKKGWFKSIIGAMTSALGAALSVAKVAASPLGFIESMISKVFGKIFGTIKTVVGFAFSKIGLLISGFLFYYFSNDQFKASMKEAVGSIDNYLKSHKGKIINFISNGINYIWDGLVKGVTWCINTLYNQLTGNNSDKPPSRFNSILGSIWDILSGTFKRSVNHIFKFFNKPGDDLTQKTTAICNHIWDSLVKYAKMGAVWLFNLITGSHETKANDSDTSSKLSFIFKSILGSLWTVLKNVTLHIIDSVYDLFTTNSDTILTSIVTVGETVRNVAGNIRKSVIGFVKSLFGSDDNIDGEEGKNEVKEKVKTICWELCKYLGVFLWEVALAFCETIYDVSEAVGELAYGICEKFVSFIAKAIGEMFFTWFDFINFAINDFVKSFNKFRDLFKDGFISGLKKIGSMTLDAGQEIGLDIWSIFAGSGDKDKKKSEGKQEQGNVVPATKPEEEKKAADNAPVVQTVSQQLPIAQSRDNVVEAKKDIENLKIEVQKKTVQAKQQKLQKSVNEKRLTQAAVSSHETTRNTNSKQSKPEKILEKTQPKKPSKGLSDDDFKEKMLMAVDNLAIALGEKQYLAVVPQA